MSHALTETAKSLAACLPPGGAVLIEPFIESTSFICDNHVTMDTYTSPNLHLARAATAKRDGNICVCNMHWLVARREKGWTALTKHIDSPCSPRQSCFKPFGMLALTVAFISIDSKPVTGFSLAFGAHDFVVMVRILVDHYKTISSK
jgi:hypothetical protein